MYGYTLFPDELSQDVQDIEKEKIRFAAPNRFKIKKKKLTFSHTCLLQILYWFSWPLQPFPLSGLTNKPK